MKPKSPSNPHRSRRKFLRAFGKVCAGGLIAGIWTRFCEPHWIEIVAHPLPIPNLPEALVGKRLVQMSDLHIGATDVDYVASVVHRVNELHPDFIALTGDFINHTSLDAVSDVERLLKSIDRPPLGTIACLGNHDYGRAWSQTNVAETVARAVRSNGITLLRNEAIEIGGVQIVGLDDLWSPRFRPSALRIVDPNRAAICLSHNPDTCDLPIWQNFRGVILSGHTHGGQCKIPFLPPPLLPVRNRRYVAVFYEIDANRLLYITRGVGHTLPIRFNCRPEVTVFTLSRA